MKTLKITLMSALLVLGFSVRAADSDDPAATKQVQGNGVIAVGQNVTDVCQCNASSKGLFNGPQYDSLMPDTGSDASGATGAPAGSKGHQ